MSEGVAGTVAVVRTVEVAVGEGAAAIEGLTGVGVDPLGGVTVIAVMGHPVGAEVGDGRVNEDEWRGLLLLPFT